MPSVTYRSEFPPFFVTCDLVVLSVRAGALHVLLVRRGGEPYAGRLALPGGFVEIDENLEDAAYRELGEEAGVGRDDVILEQLAAFGDPDRDPRSRVVSVAWLALGADLPEPTAGSDAAEAQWVPVDSALSYGALGGTEELAFDHGRILAQGVERARAEARGHRLRGRALRRAVHRRGPARRLRGRVGDRARPRQLPPQGHRGARVPDVHR